MKARITITLKQGVLDPQGKAIAGALHALGFGSVGNVRQGKYIEVEVAEKLDARGENEKAQRVRQRVADAIAPKLIKLAIVVPESAGALPGLEITRDGVRACKTLTKEGLKVNVTLIFSAAQALLAAKAGATMVSPFVGRLDDIGEDGMAGIRLSAEYPGAAYQELQQALLAGGAAQRRQRAQV